jgi:hypothetical protein
MSAPSFNSNLGSGGHASGGGTASDLTVSVTPIATTNTALVAHAGIHDGTFGGKTVGSVVFDPTGSNLSFTKVAEADSGGGVTNLGGSWILLNPPTGAAKNVKASYLAGTATSAIPQSDHLIIDQWDGVISTGGFTTLTGGTATNPNVSFDNLKTDSTLVSFVWQWINKGSPSPYTPGTGMNETADGTTGAGAFNDAGFNVDWKSATATGTNTMFVTPTNFNVWGMAALELQGL